MIFFRVIIVPKQAILAQTSKPLKKEKVSAISSPKTTLIVTTFKKKVEEQVHIINTMTLFLIDYYDHYLLGHSLSVANNINGNLFIISNDELLF